MNKTILTKPVIICFYGFPGSGKSYLARNLAESVQLANVSGDRIRMELFDNPRFDNQENAILTHLMKYMTQEFLNSGVSVTYDTNAFREAQRRGIREIARKYKSEYLLVWIQIDHDTAFARTQNRDRRTSDDKFAQPMDRGTFDKILSGMQNPQGEEYLVVSGKHNFATQKSAILNRLYQMGVIGSDTVRGNVTAPGLINLVPNPQAGRVDLSRRNIAIR